MVGGRAVPACGRSVADANDPQMWLRLHQQARTTRTWRGAVLAGQFLTVVLVVPALWHTLPWPVSVLAAGGAVAGLARIGRPADRPIITPAVVAGRFRRVNTDIMLRAYYAAGLGNPDKENARVAFGAAMARDASAPGHRSRSTCRYGKTFDDAIKARGAIASGLDVALSQVFITRDPSSHRRHTLWVADRDPLALGAGRTPLLRCKPTDIWSPAPFGLDERGNKRRGRPDVDLDADRRPAPAGQDVRGPVRWPCSRHWTRT